MIVCQAEVYGPESPSGTSGWVVEDLVRGTRAGGSSRSVKGPDSEWKALLITSFPSPVNYERRWLAPV